MLSRILLFLLVTVGVLFSAGLMFNADPSRAQDAGVLCVAPDGDPSASGSCWDDPMDLDAATRAAEPGSQIWLRQGTYVSRDDPYSAFYMPDGVDLIGGFTGSADSASERSTDPRDTILDGESTRFTVLIIAGLSDATVQNLTISNGAATLIADEAIDLQRRGGGVYISNASVTLQNVLLENNQARFGGGGMYIDEPGDVTLESVEFNNNQTTHPQSGRGGGLRVRSGSVTMRDTTFDDNSAIRGGGLFIDAGDVSIESSDFTDNDAADRGGGLSLYSGSVSISKSRFSGNIAFREGGGIFVSRAGQKVSIDHSTIISNRSGDGGGGAWVQASEVEINRTNINQNSAGIGPGGGIYLGNATAHIRSSRIQGNQAGLGGGIANRNVNTAIVNTLISGNLAGSPELVIDPDAGRPASDDPHRENVITDPWRGIITGEAFGSDYLADDALDDAVDRSAGGLLLHGEGSVSLTNVTLAANQSEGVGGAVFHAGSIGLSIQNSIIFGNERTLPGNDRSGPDILITDPGALDPGQVQISNSIIEDGCPDGDLVECLSVSRDDPRFREAPDRNSVPTLEGDFRLWFTSPAIDVGDSGHLPADIQLDLNNEPRITEKRPDFINGRPGDPVDLGAFEAQIPENESGARISATIDGGIQTIDVNASIDQHGRVSASVTIETGEISVRAFVPGRLYREDDRTILDGEALLESGAMVGMIIEQDADEVRVSTDSRASTGWMKTD